jgi:hypothetical protein
MFKSKVFSSIKRRADPQKFKVLLLIAVAASRQTLKPIFPLLRIAYIPQRVFLLFVHSLQFIYLVFKKFVAIKYVAHDDIVYLVCGTVTSRKIGVGLAIRAISAVAAVPTHVYILAKVNVFLLQVLITAFSLFRVMEAIGSAVVDEAV